MTLFPTRDEVLTVGSVACGFTVVVGDEGLLAAAIARPQTSVFGIDAYPTDVDKAAALMHSLCLNYPLVDGNKRTAWAAAWLLLGLNGIDLSADFDVDAAEALMNGIAIEHLDWSAIAATLSKFRVKTS
ncbi:MAG: hypothetical protein C0482_29025 [Gordonia sp.]|nr:hypothetical protein [Gordonia sp. (in: high G+C Gram-positive bacteria)]